MNHPSDISLANGNGTAAEDAVPPLLCDDDSADDGHCCAVASYCHVLLKTGIPLFLWVLVLLRL